MTLSVMHVYHVKFGTLVFTRWHIGRDTNLFFEVINDNNNNLLFLSVNNKY